MSPKSIEISRIRTDFRPDLQGLRAIAVTLVLLAHAEFAWFRGGFIGVDVFFVLSGYLITGLLLRELHETGRIRLLHFYARRLKRLLPALLVMIIVATGIGFYLLSDFEAMRQLASAPYAISWTSNLYFAFDTVDYFEELAEKDLFLHTWSLGVEEQFYIVWPLLLIALFFAIGKSALSQQKIGAWSISLGIIALIGFTASIALGSISQASAFYLMPARIWQFSLGALVFIALPGFAAQEAELSRDAFFKKTSAAWLTLGIGLTIIVASAYLLHPKLTYPGFWALAPSLGAVLVIAAGYGNNRGNGGPLAHPALVWVGDRSYSLYLWHWPIFTLGLSLGLADQGPMKGGLILLSLLAAILSYRFVELPFWKGHLSRATASLALLSSMLTILLMIAFLRPLFQDLDSKFENNADLRIRFPIARPEIYRKGCDTWYVDAEVKPCNFGQSDAPNTVMLLGDSIGAQWFSIVPEVFPSPGWRSVILTKSACAIVDEDFFYERIGKIYDICTNWRNKVIARIEANPPDVLILGSSASYGFSETQWVEGTTRIIDRLSKAVDTVFVIPGTPKLGFNGPGCIARHESPNREFKITQCSSDSGVEASRTVAKYLAQALAAFPNAYLMNLNDIVCPGGSCRAVSADGHAVFRDSQHLNDLFVQARTDEIRGRLEEVLSDSVAKADTSQLRADR